MRRVALRLTSTFGGPLVDEQGRLHGDDSGMYLLRRMIGLFDKPIVAVDGYGDWWDTGDYEVMPTDRLPTNDVVLVNFDVLDTPHVYRSLKKSDAWHFPSVLNFVWWNVSEYSDARQRAMIGWSCGAWPTVTNSVRTTQEVKREILRWCSPALAIDPQIATCPLGVDCESSMPPREPQEMPTVWYPSTWLFARKNPALWLTIVDKVASSVRLTGEMRLHDRHRVPDRLEGLQRFSSWLMLDSMLPRDQVATAMAKRDVFVATAADESYGLAYLEAMRAGVVGIFPDRPWAHAILPPDWPLVYKNETEGAELLHAVLSMRDRGQQNYGAWGRAWVEQHHDRRQFDRLFPELVATLGETR